MIQDNTVESTINELHSYESILLDKIAAEKRIAIIEGKNGITQKIKKQGGVSGGADTVVQDKTQV